MIDDRRRRNRMSYAHYIYNVGLCTSLRVNYCVRRALNEDAVVSEVLPCYYNMRHGVVAYYNHVVFNVSSR